MSDIAESAKVDRRRAPLDRLVAELARRGFEATRSASRGGVPIARVVNPEVRALSETVACCRDVDGTLGFFGRGDRGSPPSMRSPAPPARLPACWRAGAEPSHAGHRARGHAPPLGDRQEDRCA